MDAILKTDKVELEMTNESVDHQHLFVEKIDAVQDLRVTET